MYQKFPAFIHSLKQSKNSSCSQLSQGTGHLIFLTKYKKHKNEQLSDFSRFLFASTDVNELNKHLRTQKTKFLVTTKREHGGKFYLRNRGQNQGVGIIGCLLKVHGLSPQIVATHIPEYKNTIGLIQMSLFRSARSTF